MLAGVKSQMTGWLSGGIPGLSGRGAGEATEVEAGQQTAEASENQASRENIQGTLPDNVKDDDASRWVAGYVGSVLQKLLGMFPIYSDSLAYRISYQYTRAIQSCS